MLRIFPILTLFSLNLRETFGRDYALAVHVPTDSISCNTGNTISFEFYSNCAMLVYTCSTYDAVTSAQTYFPVSVGTTYYSSFTGTDIGEISHIQFSTNGDDAYCIQSFDVLLNDTTQLWSNCTMEYTSHMVIMSTADETGLFASGSMSDITFRVDDQSAMCTQWSPYTESPTNNPSIIPTAIPTTYPSSDPTSNPSMNPTINPTIVPSADPTVNPSIGPSMIPSMNPSLNPSINPSMNPTGIPIATDSPTDVPTSTTSEPSQVTTTGIINSAPPSGQPTLLPTENSSAKSNSNVIDTSSELFVAYVVIAILVFCLCQVFCTFVIIYFYKRHNKQKQAQKNSKGVEREIELMNTSNAYDNVDNNGLGRVNSTSQLQFSTNASVPITTGNVNSGNTGDTSVPIIPASILAASLIEMQKQQNQQQQQGSGQEQNDDIRVGAGGEAQAAALQMALNLPAQPNVKYNGVGGGNVNGEEGIGGAGVTGGNLNESDDGDDLLMYEKTPVQE